MKQKFNQKIITECRQKLMSLKAELLNRVHLSRNTLHSIDKHSGDEIDQSVALIEEHQFLSTNNRIRNQILEIELALARMDNGTYGICEETEEPIESERLILMPWTRLSIEGAEIREALQNRYADKH